MLLNAYDEMYLKALEAFEYTNEQNPINHKLVKDAFRKRPNDAYKGSCGSLLVCAASTGLTGAACLSAMAALRGGCGLVTLCCPEDLNTILEIKLTEVMTKPVASKNGVMSAKAWPAISLQAKKSDAVLFGPGLSWHKSIRKICEKLICSLNKCLIADADGLNVISEDTSILKKASCPVIITPHVGEFARLTAYDKKYILENPEKTAMEFSSKYNVITVLKSHKTIVTDGKSVYTNILGNPGMATAGCGDVLSGLIASFAAQGNSPLESALAGVYVHSLAGDMAAMQMGEYSLVASDILNNIAYAVKQICKQ